MSKASNRPETGAGHRIECLQPWIAALLSALLHLLALLLAILSPTPVMTPPQASGSDSWVQVDFIGETREPDQQPPTPPSGIEPISDRVDPPTPAEASPATSHLRSTPVPETEDPVPPDLAPAPGTRMVQRPRTPASAPSPARNDAAPRQARAAAANPSATTRRRPEAWGQPPGLVVQTLAPEDASSTPGPARNQGRGHDATSDEPSLELGGYHVYYDLRSERTLRSWRDRGMTELFIPLPGTRQYMVCPLEIALRRDSGKCRPLAPNDPELGTIGDARDVISVLQVYRRGELLWRGPGPYR